MQHDGLNLDGTATPTAQASLGLTAATAVSRTFVCSVR